MTQNAIEVVRRTLFELIITGKVNNETTVQEILNILEEMSE